jgi:hypothetical protein
MRAGQVRQLLIADAVFDLAAGLMLLAGTWDDLWGVLDLPQGRPALFVQIGGALAVGFAYLLWRAANEPALRAPVALAAAIANGLGALIVLVWLVTDELEDLSGLGTASLIVLAVVLGCFALLQARAVRRPRGG